MKRNGVLIQFSLITGLFFAVFASLSYQSVLLMEKGYTSDQIGLCNAVGSIIGFGVLPLWGRISDRVGTAKPVFLGCMTALILMFLLFPGVAEAADSAWLVFGYCAIATVFRQPTNALLDAWAVSELSVHGIGYGSVRLWGSIGYSLASMGLGLVVGVYTDTASAFYLMAVFGIPLLLIAGRWKPVRSEASAKAESPKALLGNRKLMVYLLYTLGLNIYLSITLIFMGFILEHAGCSPSQIGLVTGLRALFEIASMYAAARLQKKLPMGTILILPGLLFGLEHLLYGFCTGLGGIMAVMVLSGFAGGIFYSMGPSYIHQIVPEPLRNTAQSMAGMTMAFTAIVGNFLGGQVVANFGITALTTGCGIVILFLTGCFVLGTFFWKERT